MTYSQITGPTDSDSPLRDADDSTWINRRTTELAQRAANARKGSGRRRLIDPSTCERDYSQAEVEFMKAMQAYKTTSGRMFPTWGEVLQVIHGLGYQKLGPEESTDDPSE
ncbi:hypothetical protein V5E97_29300 [Singulisphaera sp. Ch08]|uniref:Uncharacterized protein n=1 Tax=Singulisphaera sp. Ch08 TaxID=3120278 RepID=A0AAU7CBB7_9BACT